MAHLSSLLTIITVTNGERTFACAAAIELTLQMISSRPYVSGIINIENLSLKALAAVHLYQTGVKCTMLVQMKKSVDLNSRNKFQVLFYGVQAVKRNFISPNGL